VCVVCVATGYDTHIFFFICHYPDGAQLL